MTEAGSPAPTSASVYIHGTDAEEQDRLTGLNRLINRRCLSALRLVPGESILDVGSGLGQMSRLMARAVAGPGVAGPGVAGPGVAGPAVAGPGVAGPGVAGPGVAGPGVAGSQASATSGTPRILGIEASMEQLAEARRQATEAGETDLVDFRSGDARRLPLTEDEWGSFNLAHTRFLLEHVTDPLVVVQSMVRAVRPGGRLLLLDDDHDLLRLWPEVPGLAEVWRAYMRGYDRIGCDPYIGRRLVSLLHEAGATPVRCEWVFFGACAGEAGFTGFVENLARILLGARDATAAAGGIGAVDIDRAVAALRTWGSRPDAAFWYGIALAEGRRRG